MYCDNCGSRNDFDAIFCKKCGLNFHKSNKKIEDNKKRKEKITKILENKEKILGTISVVLITFLAIFHLYFENDMVKYHRYLKSEGFNCKGATCTKKQDEYKIVIIYQNNRIIYKTDKVNEVVTFNYAGNDLGSFEITDSLSTFTCSYVEGKIIKSSCIDSLNKAGKEKYLNKMNDIVKKVNTIVKESKISL